MPALGRRPILKGQQGINSLKRHAIFWTYLLCALRDGADGYVQELTWGPIEQFRGEPALGQSLAIAKGEGQEAAVRYGSPLGALPLARTMSQQQLQTWQRTQDGWHYVPPISPSPQVWARLKKARTVSEVRSVAHDLKGWANRTPCSYYMIDGQRREDPRVPILPMHLGVFHTHAKKILAAKKLWTYPRTNRPMSDDKRIEFFGKSLAGLMFGLAPATAQRRLTGWRWPQRAFEKSIVGHFEQMKSRLKQQKEAKR
jgi:hypothetical protein